MLLGTIPQGASAQLNAAASATITATVLPSISFVLMRSNTGTTKENNSPLTMNLRGNENIIVVVNSEKVKSENILQLKTEKATSVEIPVLMQTAKTSITYLSS